MFISKVFHIASLVFTKYLSNPEPPLVWDGQREGSHEFTLFYWSVWDINSAKPAVHFKACRYQIRNAHVPRQKSPQKSCFSPEELRRDFS